MDITTRQHIGTPSFVLRMMAKLIRIFRVFMYVVKNILEIYSPFFATRAQMQIDLNFLGPCKKDKSFLAWQFCF